MMKDSKSVFLTLFLMSILTIGLSAQEKAIWCLSFEQEWRDRHVVLRLAMTDKAVFGVKWWNPDSFGKESFWSANIGGNISSFPICSNSSDPRTLRTSGSSIVVQRTLWALCRHSSPACPTPWVAGRGSGRERGWSAGPKRENIAFQCPNWVCKGIHSTINPHRILTGR